MALFGEKDKNMNVLTRMVQVDATSKIEINTFYNQAMFGEISRETLSEKGIEEVKESIAICVLMMRDLADFSSIRPRVLDWINSHRNSSVERLEVSEEIFGEGATYALYPADDPIPTSQLQIDRWFLDRSIRGTFAGAFRQLVMGIVNQTTNPDFSVESIVRTCIECENPYVVTKKGQKFCSNRCGARYGQRLRRKKQNLS